MSADKTLHICIASTGDIVVERNIVREVCNGLNDNASLSHPGISFRTVMWEDMVGSSQDAKEIMERYLNECDMLVCILYKRLEDSSSKNRNNTLPVFLSACDLWKTSKKPHFVFFFKQVKVSSVKDITDPQLIRVFELKEIITKAHTVQCYDFSSPHELCEKVYDHMENWLNEYFKKG